MRTINVTFRDEEHLELMEIKDYLRMNWPDFILLLTRFSLSTLKKKMKDEVWKG